MTKCLGKIWKKIVNFIEIYCRCEQELLENKLNKMMEKFIASFKNISNEQALNFCGHIKSFQSKNEKSHVEKKAKMSSICDAIFEKLLKHRTTIANKIFNNALHLLPIPVLFTVPTRGPTTSFDLLCPLVETEY